MRRRFCGSLPRFLDGRSRAEHLSLLDRPFWGACPASELWQNQVAMIRNKLLFFDWWRRCKVAR